MFSPRFVSSKQQCTETPTQCLFVVHDKGTKKYDVVSESPFLSDQLKIRFLNHSVSPVSSPPSPTPSLYQGSRGILESNL